MLYEVITDANHENQQDVAEARGQRWSWLGGPRPGLGAAGGGRGRHPAERRRPGFSDSGADLLRGPGGDEARPHALRNNFV